MPEFTLRLSRPDPVDTNEAASSFYWLLTPDSSFTGDIGPSLGALGPIPPLSVDFVRIAAAVFAADRSVLRKRGGSNWNRRDIALTVPVSDASAWQGVADDLQTVIGFLTGDEWALRFSEEAAPSETVALTPPPVQRVVLLSGGADSAVGALSSRSGLQDDEQHTLVSHFSATTLSPIQKAVAATVVELVPGPGQQHQQFHLGRRSKRLDGKRYRSETSSRSRSLLFIALGLAVGSTNEAPLWIAENGFASLNPPLGPERLGSLSTRTTHPRFLSDLRRVLESVGAHGDLSNPFANSTKGEMFKTAGELVGQEAASQLLSSTNSCAHTGQRAFKLSPMAPCGVCFGCVVRRAAFHASGIPDATQYISADGNPALQAWLDSQSVEQPVRNFVQRGVRQRDLIALSLPDEYPLDAALDICERGTRELSGLLS